MHDLSHVLCGEILHWREPRSDPLRFLNNRALGGVGQHFVWCQTDRSLWRREQQKLEIPHEPEFSAPS